MPCRQYLHPSLNFVAQWPFHLWRPRKNSWVYKQKRTNNKSIHREWIKWARMLLNVAIWAYRLPCIFLLIDRQMLSGSDRLISNRHWRVRWWHRIHRHHYISAGSIERNGRICINSILTGTSEIYSMGPKSFAVLRNVTTNVGPCPISNDTPSL